MTVDVTDIDDYRPHRSGHAQCYACDALLVIVAPSSTDEIWKECPECEAMSVQFCDLPAPVAEHTI